MDGETNGRVQSIKLYFDFRNNLKVGIISSNMLAHVTRWMNITYHNDLMSSHHPSTKSSKVTYYTTYMHMVTSNQLSEEEKIHKNTK